MKVKICFTVDDSSLLYRLGKLENGKAILNSVHGLPVSRQISAKDLLICLGNKLPSVANDLMQRLELEAMSHDLGISKEKLLSDPCFHKGKTKMEGADHA